MIFRAWGVVCAKGKAVFLDNTRALEYATKQHGIVVKLMGQYELSQANNQDGYVEEEETSQGTAGEQNQERPIEAVCGDSPA